MTGQEHYTEAERLTAIAEHQRQNNQDITDAVQLATLHIQLARLWTIPAPRKVRQWSQ